MKKILTLQTIFLLATHCSYSQLEGKTGIFFDGLYIAKTGAVPAANIEIFTYLKFYDDGTVYLQSVSSNDPQSVSKWFSRDKKFSQKGLYAIDSGLITIQVNNSASEDSKLEGKAETNYKGVIKKNGQLCLIRNKEVEERCFMFSKTP